MIEQDVIDCYNQAAYEYAKQLFDELDKKPFDRMVLRQFAADNGFKGPMIDLGCGPGQTTRFLADHGVTDIIGVDLSEGMITEAKSLNPDLIFSVNNMLQLQYPNKSFGSAVAFYAIVHFNLEQLLQAFKEIQRILIGGGEFLFSYHVGNEVYHRDEFLGKKVNIDFTFFETDQILKLLKLANWDIIDIVERYPYQHVEHPTKRAYITVRKHA